MPDRWRVAADNDSNKKRVRPAMRRETERERERGGKGKSPRKRPMFLTARGFVGVLMCTLHVLFQPLYMHSVSASTSIHIIPLPIDERKYEDITYSVF